MAFQLHSKFQPAGDQITAIQSLCDGFKDQLHNQVLLGVTGSGKTFTMAQIINTLQRPAIIMAHNKTLAAQLYGELKDFFPNNHVEYFVSYYDYYQPEAYVPRTDTYIEKDSSINEYIDRLRHSATRHLLEYKDVILVASVSSIYGIGDVDFYRSMVQHIYQGQHYNIQNFARDLVTLQYDRNDVKFIRGTFRIRGDTVDIFPSHLEDYAWRVQFFDDEVESIQEFEVLTGNVGSTLKDILIYPNTHYIVPKRALSRAIEGIKSELKICLQELHHEKKLLEAQRLEERTNFDLEQLISIGMCKGIENYSRHLTGRAPGDPPPTLFDYLHENTMVFVDESHVTVPQIRGMYNGDFARKSNLVHFGFRLPSAVDNRPLKFEEWDAKRPQTLFVSATPGEFELKQTEGAYVEQLIRPTGLLDPICEVLPVKSQVDEVIHAIREVIKKQGRILVTTLTKKMAEDLTEYLLEAGIKANYLHSDVDTLERVQIITELRQGVFDVLVGINLLREGLDIPECQLVAILDADKEGFLRSKVSLIQTIGRAARHVNGRVLLFADRLTDSLKFALDETNRRRKKQKAYNIKHHITPKSIEKSIKTYLQQPEEEDKKYNSKGITLLYDKKLRSLSVEDYIVMLDRKMYKMADDLDFENALLLRDEKHALERCAMDLPLSVVPFSKTVWHLMNKG